VPYLVGGALLVVVCAVSAVVVATRLGDRQLVLALTRTQSTGHVLGYGDVRSVEVGAESGVELLPATSLSTVVGQPLAYALPAGTLLTAAALGPPTVPGAGEAVAAVGLREGQFPPDLQPGATVAVLVTGGADQPTGGPATGPAAGTAWTGVVLAVTGQPSQSGQGGDVTVVSLRMSEAQARAVATAPAGRLALVVLPGGER
jgi:hypothetical protein